MRLRDQMKEDVLTDSERKLLHHLRQTGDLDLSAATRTRYRVACQLIDLGLATWDGALLVPVRQR